MACKAQNTTELKNLVENKSAIFSVKANQTQSETVENLKYLQNNFVKKDGKYTVKNTNAQLTETVTGRIGKWWERRNPIPPTADQLKIWNQKAEIGNFMHDVNELVGNAILEHIKDMSVDEFFKSSIDIENLDYAEGLKKIKVEYGYDIPVTQVFKVFEGIYDIVRSVYVRQRNINNRTGDNTGKPYIVFEQILIDPKEDLGGTADMIAIYSDNTATVLDFKTKVPRKDQLDSSGNLKKDSWKLSETDRKRYKMQLASLSKILKQKVGVNKVITAPIHFIRVSLPWDKNTNGYQKNITKISHGAKQEEVLQQLRPLSETTGFDDLDKFLQNVDKKIRDYENKKNQDRSKKAFYNEKINELEQSKRDILTNHNFNTILTYGQKIEKLLTADYVEKLTINELREHIDELKMMSMLADSTYEYRNFILKNVPTRAGEIDQFKADMALMYSELSDKINMLEDELYNKKIITLVEKTTNTKITDDGGRLLPFNDDGFFGRYFNQLSHFENPVFKTLKSLLSSSNYDTRQDVDQVIKDVQKNEDALYDWMKQNGKNRQWFIDAFIDLKTDNLINKLSDSFVKELADVKARKDATKIAEYYQPFDNYKEWYDKTLAEKKNKKEIDDFKLNFELDNQGKNSVAWIKALYSGKLKLKDSVQNKNLSDKYKYIQSVPQLANYYNMMLKWNKEFRSILGLDYFELPNNFIPNIRKSAVERIQDLGAINGIGATIQDMIDDLNVREDDVMYGETEDGRLVRRIPKFFVNPFKDENENVVIGEKSYELGKSLVLFAKMAYNFKNMNKIEAEVMALKEFISERGEEFITKKGKHLEDYVGNKLTTKMADTVKIFDTFVDMYLYGINIQPSIGDKSGEWEKRILTAKQYFSFKSLGLGFVPAFGGFLAASTNAIIEGSKGVIYTKKNYQEAIKDAWNDREKFLALNAFFDPMGMQYGNFSVSEKSKPGDLGSARERNFISKYVNGRLLLRPFSKGDETLDEVITASMSKNYYVNESGEVRRIRAGEEEKYKDRTIWNLFNYKNGQGSLNISDDQLKNVIIKFREAVQSGQSRIKGTIPEEDRAYWQSQILGQVIMHFKSWMPGILRERFGKIKYNDAIDSVELGKYTALSVEFYNAEKLDTIDYLKTVIPNKIVQFTKHLLFLGKIGKFNDMATKQMFFENWLDENPHYRGKMTFEEFTEYQQKQIKSLMVELRVLMMFAALLMLMGGDWDDDGEKDYKQYWITRKIAAVLFKTNQELGFVYSPTEFASMVRTPIPMIGILTDATKVITNGFDELKDAIIGENTKSDKTDIGYYTSKMIPGINQFAKFLDYFNNDSGDSYK